MRTRHKSSLLVAVAGAVLMIGGLAWCFFGRSDDFGYMKQFSDDLEKSLDLKADIRLMRETRPLGGTPDPTHGPDPRASTKTAINAASRVFNTVELVGKSRQEVIDLIGDPKSSNDSIYNFPFFPAPRGAMIYRFDSGAYGWQFNILLGNDGKVRDVQRAWIH